jgi:hypothetical protein
MPHAIHIRYPEAAKVSNPDPKALDDIFPILPPTASRAANDPVKNRTRLWGPHSLTLPLTITYHEPKCPDGVDTAVTETGRVLLPGSPANGREGGRGRERNFVWLGAFLLRVPSAWRVLLGMELGYFLLPPPSSAPWSPE